MRWSPGQYLRFADHRLRPGLELLTRIPDIDPGVVFDLGCGPGNLTREIATRWPEARVVGVDSSVEMISKAESDVPGIEFEVGDIETWTPEHEVDPTTGRRRPTPSPRRSSPTADGRRK